MSQFYLGMAFFLSGTLLIGLHRVRSGPRRGDRMLAAQIFGTTGTAILLLFSEAFGMPGVRNVALVFTLLGLVNVFAFALGGWAAGGDE